MANYEIQDLQQIWNKGMVIPGFDPNVWRRDVYNYAMRWQDYGNRNDYGWHVDHIVPQARGGLTIMSNLQPLHWKANLAKSDNQF